MEDLTLVSKIAIWAVPVIFGITVHEVAHGWVANRFGDPTARQAGRLTLNPVKHVDPVGTLVVPMLLMLFSNFILGWAKPVPVDARRLRNPRRDMAVVALAGPGANVLMALFWALVVKLALFYDTLLGSAALPLIYMGVAGVFINTILCVLNLLPLPPLDGGRVLTSLVPPSWTPVMARIEPFGILIILVLLVTGVLAHILYPTFDFVASLLDTLSGFSRGNFYGVLQMLMGAG